LGSPPELNAYYLGLLTKIVRVLRFELNLKSWWEERGTETVNQRLLSFFRDIVATRISDPVVIFLDEIDSTLKLPYTDDLFTAIRGMYNERPIVDAYRRITFCLLGVATPNELIKSRRTTAYNIGTTIDPFRSGLDREQPAEAGSCKSTAQGDRSVVCLPCSSRRRSYVLHNRRPACAGTPLHAGPSGTTQNRRNRFNGP
jgi:hypothetical protein